MRQPAMFPAKTGLPRALEAAFARFWASYPERRPNPRALAEKEFAKAVKAGAAADDLIAAATGYAAEVKLQGTANEFIVHAATFLRQARWRDYLTPEAPIGAPASPAEPPHELWPELLSHMDEPTFRAWIGRCDVTSRDGAELVLSAPSTFIAARIRQEFVPLLKRVLECTVTITVEPRR